MATAIIEKRNHAKAVKTKLAAKAPKLEERTCPIEKLQGNGLTCTICTYYTVVGPVQMIQPTCPVVELVRENVFGGDDRQSSGRLPVAPPNAELAQARVESRTLQAKSDGGAIYSPYDAMGLAERS